ncbi:MAG: hypothetical protein IPN74_09505 [Haliscomenobacter sp.]|nr:hypothetical protein [Haliscomenobacter sp.]
MRYQPTIQTGADHLERIKRAAARGEWITALGLADELENYLNENEAERTKVLAEHLHAIVDDIQTKVNQVMNLTLK